MIKLARALCWAIALAPLASSATTLPERPRAVLRQQLVKEASVTVVVRDVASGESLIELNPLTPRSPASTLKLLPTWAALEMLGPAHSWKTRVYADGPIRAGVLRGNLYLQGGGDPMMTLERWWKLVTDLRQTGLRVIEGDVVIDEELFAPLAERRGDFDRRPQRTYNVLPHPLLVNLQSIEFTVRAADDGQTIEVGATPLPSNLDLQNRIRPSTGPCNSRNRNFSIQHAEDRPLSLVVSGTVSVNCPPQSARQPVMTPTDYAYGSFRQLWEQQGGSIGGGLLRAPTPPKAKLLLSRDSPSLAEVIRVVNKFSSNVMARTLVLTIAAENGTRPATSAAGEALIDGWLRQQGLVFEELVIDNGSGLSRKARMSGDSMARMLAAAWRSRYAPEFIATLPMGGLDGSLRKRFKRLRDPSRVRMKTGSLNGVSSLAGYVTGQSGRTYAVVIMVTQTGAQYGSGDLIEGAVVDWVLDQ